MVATRLERKQKLDRLITGAPIPPVPRASTVPSTVTQVTTVNQFTVSTLASTETVAFPADGSPRPQIEFCFAHVTGGFEAHLLAVRFLRRRGPDYMPRGTRVIVTLDARGRQRSVEVR